MGRSNSDPLAPGSQDQTLCDSVLWKYVKEITFCDLLDRIQELKDKTQAVRNIVGDILNTPYKISYIILALKWEKKVGNPIFWHLKTFMGNCKSNHELSLSTQDLNFNNNFLRSAIFQPLVSTHIYVFSGAKSRHL